MPTFFSFISDCDPCMQYSTSCGQCRANGCSYCSFPTGGGSCNSPTIAGAYPDFCSRRRGTAYSTTYCPATSPVAMPSTKSPTTKAPVTKSPMTKAPTTIAPTKAPTRTPIAPVSTVCNAFEIQTDSCASKKDSKCDVGLTCSTRTDCLYVVVHRIVSSSNPCRYETS
jgi:hypothetical protein